MRVPMGDEWMKLVGSQLSCIEEAVGAGRQCGAALIADSLHTVSNTQKPNHDVVNDGIWAR